MCRAVTLELPKSNRFWSDERLKKFLTDHNMQKFADSAACAMGLETSQGQPIGKVFRIAFSDQVPIFEQGALSPMSVFPAQFPILCLPEDKRNFRAKSSTKVTAFHKQCTSMEAKGLGQKLQQWQNQGLQPLAVALIGTDQAPPLWTHPTGCDFVRGSRLAARP